MLADYQSLGLGLRSLRVASHAPGSQQSWEGGYFNASGSCRPLKGMRIEECGDAVRRMWGFGFLGAEIAGFRFQFPDLQTFRFSNFQIFTFPDFQIFRFSHFNNFFGLQISECGCGYQDPGSTRSRRSQQSKIHDIASDLMIFHQHSWKFTTFD